MAARGTSQLSAESGLVRSVLRALELLELLGSAREPVGIVQLARTLSLPPSTAHRLCRSLVRAGFIAQDPATGRYTVGPNLLRVAAGWGPDLLLGPQAEDVVRRLRDGVRETSYLALARHDSALVVAVAEADDWLRVGPTPRELLPLHATAAGKLLLAFSPPGWVSAWLGRAVLQRYTDRTVVNAEQLRRQLEEIRVRGFATADEELSRGVRELAVPAWLWDGRTVAALAIAGPAHRLRFQEAGPTLDAMLRAAAELSAVFKGGSPGGDGRGS
jgi:DNA-binding IclR family transcriptional regulator